MRDFIMGNGGLAVMIVFYVINVFIMFTSNILLTRIVAVIAVVGLSFSIMGHPML